LKIENEKLSNAPHRNTVLNSQFSIYWRRWSISRCCAGTARVAMSCTSSFASMPASSCASRAPASSCACGISHSSCPWPSRPNPSWCDHDQSCGWSAWMLRPRTCAARLNGAESRRMPRAGCGWLAHFGRTGRAAACCMKGWDGWKARWSPVWARGCGRVWS
jgi:hypothetical protein